MDSSMSFLKRNLAKLRSVQKMDIAFHNVLVNAFAVMLIYSAHFGSCAVAPIILESMKGIGGIDSHLLFSGMAVSSVATVLSFSFISPAIDKLGTRACLVLGGIFITTLPPSLLYPVPAVFLSFQAINGLGCALMRAASLKFLTDNSPYEKLAEYNGLHWSIFMSCILVGNTVLFVATGSNETISTGLRYRICICLTAIGMIGVLLYLIAIKSKGDDKSYNEDSFLLSQKDGLDSPYTKQKKPLPDQRNNFNCDTESRTEHALYQSALLEPLASSPIKGQDAFSESRDFSREMTSPAVSSVDGEYLDLVSSQDDAGFWDSTKHLLRWSTINLVVAMWTCAVFPALFTTLGPMFVGLLLSEKRYVAVFGMSAGIGEIVGSLAAGKVVTKIGIKKSAVLVTLIACSSILLSALVFPRKTDISPTIPPSPPLFLFLGILLGTGDSSHGVLLSTLIGRVYREFSQAGFAMYSLMFNVAAMTLYMVSSYCYFEVVVWVMVSIVCATLLAILLLRKPDIQEERKDG